MPGSGIEHRDQAESIFTMTYYKKIPLNLQNLSIEVVEIRHSPKPGPTLAFADVNVGPVLIHGVSVVQNKKDNGLFVGLPMNWGKTRHFPHVELDEAIRSQVFGLVLDAWKEFSNQ
jgi:DNA-binding cell septation regulator SpoVG